MTGFDRENLNTVKVTVHAAPLHIGNLFHLDRISIEPLCQTLTKGGIPCQAVDNIEKDLWAKMLFNCVVNPLCAITQSRCGDLGNSSYSREIIDPIVREIFEVMHRSRYATHWSCAEDYLEILYTDLLPATTNHVPSMAQDLEACKRTEIDWLNGMVLRLGQQYHIPVPHNTQVYNFTKFREEQNRRRTV